jgi:CDP-glycerol glycerophosphotransferase (TagB/SpsB family)
MEIVKSKLKPGRPVIFYAGQNDFESGLQPYNENSKKYHSPVFSSSAAAALFLAELCDKNQWNFIYKPHPIMKMFDNNSVTLPASAIEVGLIDINDLIDISDLVITILSTVGYISLIRHKPTLMLGYTQLKDKGCTYQAFSLSLIEDEIKNALQHGFSLNQKQAFTKHIAQMLKYCSYDDYSDRPIRYGRKIEELMDGCLS